MGEVFAYLNGRIVPAGEAAVSVSDTGLLHGASVFTTLRSHNGRPFRLDRHIARLLAHAGKIALAVAATAEELTSAVRGVLEADELSEARIRITLTPGPVGLEPRPTTLVTASELRNDPRWYEKGLGVIVSGVRQYEGDPTVGLKTGNYLLRVLARQAAAAAGADEALFFTVGGRLAEACYCNVFLVADGQVRTPPLDTPVLDGICRQTVIELCQTLKLPCRDDEPVSGPDLQSAKEVFLTSSCSGVRPVVRLQKQPVGDETPGPVTRKIMAGYDELLEKECPKDRE